MNLNEAECKYELDRSTMYYEDENICQKCEEKIIGDLTMVYLHGVKEFHCCEYCLEKLEESGMFSSDY